MNRLCPPAQMKQTKKTNKMSESLHLQIAETLQNAQNILVVSHIRPDGDAIGSLLGFGLTLQDAGKQVQMVLCDGVPSTFRHLPGSGLVRRKAQVPIDLAVVLDCSDLQRTGEALAPLGGRAPDLNIDHHITNLNFARLNFVLPHAVATSAVLAEYLPRWGFEIKKGAASALLTGIITDTIGFRTSNTSASAMRLAAELMERGADLPELYRAGLVNKTYEAARYWGFGLERLQREGSLIWTSLLISDRKAADYNGNDDADLVNFLSSTEADVVVLFNEQKEGKVKISWRARPSLDISSLALQFGGGGHPAAAGAEVPGDLEEVQQKVLEATRTYLARQDGANNHTTI
jgi:bifunctional oligoribonuclease and PAP phosphatase NrnA